jgi:hypothetical protein
LKKDYISPDADIEKFRLASTSVITTSEDGFEDGDTGEYVDDDF